MIVRSFDARFKDSVDFEKNCLESLLQRPSMGVNYNTRILLGSVGKHNNRVVPPNLP